MRITSLVTSAAFLGSVSALVPRAFSVPSDNGFPDPDAEQELVIAKKAGGKLPGAPLPTELGPGSTTAFQLIAFNELFETAFFSSLLKNISSKAKGYEITQGGIADAEQVISVVLAQEQQHALAALGVLNSAKKFAPSPCKYQFPVDNIRDAIALAETFTAVVLGALQGANTIFASEGVIPIVRIISSVIGQEGEQNGLYRLYLDEIPPESPFLTYVPAAFAFSALQLFVVPDSCPFPLSDIDLPIFPPLNVNGFPVAGVKPETQTLKFSADLKGTDAAKNHPKELYITYTSGQQLPISIAAENVKWDGSVVSLEAEFPYEEDVLFGFTHAALTTSGKFADADDVVDCTLAAPGVIQVLNKLE